MRRSDEQRVDTGAQHVDPLGIIGADRARRAAEFARWLRSRCVPPLTPADVVGAVMLTLRPVLERAILTRGKKLSIQELTRCEIYALGAAVAVCGSIAVEAGIVSRLFTPPGVTAARVAEWYLRWRKELATYNFPGARSLGTPLPHERARMLFDVWRASGDERSLNGDVLLSDLKAGLELALGRSLQPGERDGVALAATWRELAGTDAKIVDWTYVGDDGTHRLGKTQVRDALKARLREEREWASRRRALSPGRAEESRESEFSTGVVETTIARDRDRIGDAASEQEHLAAARDVRDALAAVTAARLLRAKPGTAEWHLLQRASDLITEAVTPSAVADELGLSRSHLCEVWARLGAELKQEVASG